ELLRIRLGHSDILPGCFSASQVRCHPTLQQSPTLVLAEPWKIGDGLQTVARYEALNMGMNAARRRGDDFSAVATTVTNVIDSGFNQAEVAGALQVVELLIRAGGQRPTT
ncbi:hypothetical protein, partial [Streptomyces sp. NPDC001348]